MGNGWMARCPAHNDGRPSLKLDEKSDGTVLLRCFADCTTESICAALGLRLQDLFPPHEPRPHTNGRMNGHGASRVVATYDYRDESGALLYQVLRKEPKDFPVRRPGADGGGWIYNLEGIRRVPYRLPDVLASHRASPVFIVEGEKDVDRLWAEGLVATCNPGGAGKWRSEYCASLSGRNVIILPDNDEAGERHARAVAHSLWGTARRIKYVALPDVPPKGDVSDWLDAGNTVEQLISLASHTPDLEQAQDEAGEPAQADAPAKFKCMADVMPESVDWLWEGFLARGKFGLWEGDPGIGKTFALLAAGTAITRGWKLPGMDTAPEPSNVMLLTLEDDLADTIRPRLDHMGADVSRFFAFDEMLQFDGPGITELSAEMARIKPSLLIVDPIMAYIPSKTDIYKPNQIRTITTPLRLLAKEHNCAIVGIRHLTKGQKDRAIYRGAGGMDFVGASRLVVLVGMDPDKSGQRAIVQTKSNLGSAPLSVNFTLDADGTFLWAGAGYVSAERILATPAGEEEQSALEEAADFLRACLTPYPRKTKEVFSEAGQNGVSIPTLRLAKRKLGVEVSRHGEIGIRGGGTWMWALPELGIKGEH
jgi:putative DNA primase/helicase